jgi:hypothetical protein
MPTLKVIKTDEKDAMLEGQGSYKQRKFKQLRNERTAARFTQGYLVLWSHLVVGRQPRVSTTAWCNRSFVKQFTPHLPISPIPMDVRRSTSVSVPEASASEERRVLKIFGFTVYIVKRLLLYKQLR